MAMIRVDLQVETDAQPPVTGLARNLLMAFEVLKNPILIVVLLTLGAGIFWARKETKSLTSQLASINAEVDQQQRDSTKFAKELANAERLKKQQGEYERLVARIRGVDDNRYAFLHLMDDAARALPNESWLQQLQTTKEDPATRNVTVLVKGFAPSEGAVTEYLQRLNESPWITNGSLNNIDRVPVNRQTLVTFEISLESEIPDPSFFKTVPVSELFGAQIPTNIPTAPVNGNKPKPNVARLNGAGAAKR